MISYVEVLFLPQLLKWSLLGHSFPQLISIELHQIQNIA